MEDGGWRMGEEWSILNCKNVDLKEVVVPGGTEELKYQAKDDQMSNYKQGSEDTRQENEQLESTRECEKIGFNTLTVVVENEEGTRKKEEKMNGEGNKNEGEEDEVKEEDIKLVQWVNKATRGLQKKKNKGSPYEYLNVELKQLITEENEAMTRGIKKKTGEKLFREKESKSELEGERGTEECGKVELTNVTVEVECKENNVTVEGCTVEGNIIGGCTSENNEQVHSTEKESNKKRRLEVVMTGVVENENGEFEKICRERERGKERERVWVRGHTYAQQQEEEKIPLKSMIAVTEEIKKLNGGLQRLENMCRIRGRVIGRGSKSGQRPKEEKICPVSMKVIAGQYNERPEELKLPHCVTNMIFGTKYK